MYDGVCQTYGELELAFPAELKRAEGSVRDVQTVIDSLGTGSSAEEERGIGLVMAVMDMLRLQIQAAADMLGTLLRERTPKHQPPPDYPESPVEHDFIEFIDAPSSGLLFNCTALGPEQSHPNRSPDFEVARPVELVRAPVELLVDENECARMTGLPPPLSLPQ